VALDDGVRRYRYAELGAMVADLAERIRAGGAEPGAVVAVCLPRSVEAIVALLGVFEAGCVYLPLDPAWPDARQKAMCQDAGVATVIGPAECSALLPGTGLELSCPVRVSTGFSLRADSGWSEADPEAAAYMIFTSGTTGMPKGVRVSRANLAAFLAGLRRDYTPAEFAVTATSTSFTFDPHLIEVLGPLTAGGCVRVIPDAFSLRDVEPGVTMIATTPSVAAELLRRGWLPSTLRTLVVGGEVLSPALADQLLALPYLRRLVNAYGPTEATVQVSSYNVTRPACEPIPVGKPAIGTDIVAVDEHLHPVPDGVVGELLITGAQVAMGYAGDAELSAAKFISLPLGADGPVRAYRTGDLGRRRPDATLEYCGRVDRQVKVRGFRVEPGEVESALGRLEGISQVAVRAVGSGAAAVLVAYVVPAEPSGRFDARLARRELRTTLAEYLVPSRFVTLDALPLTRQGKLDEQALADLWRQPQPGEAMAIATGPSAQTAASGSLTAAETMVAELARQLVGVSTPIQAGDDFLDDLGGTSLGIIGLLAAMEKAFACRLSIRRALEDTTIRGLAALVSDRHDRDEKRMVLRARQRHGERPPLFLINPYVGSVLRQRRLDAYLPAECDLISVDVHDAGTDFNAGPLSIVDLAEHALVQIREAQPRGPYWLGGHSAGGLVALEAAQRLLASGEDVGGLLLIDSPATKTRLDYLWAEAVMNWPEFRAASRQDRRAALRSLVRSRWSVHRSTPRRGGSALADGVELATRRTNIATKVYRPSTYLGAVTMLWTDQGLRMARGRRALGWDRLVNGPLTSRRIAGTHNTIFDSPHIAGLGEEIGRFLGLAATGRYEPEPKTGELTSWQYPDSSELALPR
jgi:amino acid adenylation domain-containing protein